MNSCVCKRYTLQISSWLFFFLLTSKESNCANFHSYWWCHLSRDWFLFVFFFVLFCFLMVLVVVFMNVVVTMMEVVVMMVLVVVFFFFISFVYRGVVQCCNDNRQRNKNKSSRASYIVCINALHCLIRSLRILCLKIYWEAMKCFSGLWNFDRAPACPYFSILSVSSGQSLRCCFRILQFGSPCSHSLLYRWVRFLFSWSIQ